MDIEGFLVLLALWLCIPMLISEVIDLCSQKIVEWQTGENGCVDYFVAGMFGQPDSAFKFMFDLPAIKGDTLKLLPYHVNRANFGRMTSEILADIAQNQYRKVRIFAISVGAAVSVDIGQRLPKRDASDTAGDFDLELYLISPCQNSLFLSRKIRRRLNAVRPLIVALNIVLGPLAFIPVIPKTGMRFSVALASSQVDQVLSFTYKMFNHRDYVKGVILSGRDEFLDNLGIQAFYSRQSTITLEGIAHSDTVESAEKYRAAIEELMISPRS